MIDTPKKDKAGLSDNKPEETCEWYINSQKHFNCFWVYVLDKSSIDGSMPEMVQSEIAQLLGWSNTKTHFMLKQAMIELVDALTKYRANQLLSSDPHHVDTPQFSSGTIPNYTSDDPNE